MPTTPAEDLEQAEKLLYLNLGIVSPELIAANAETAHALIALAQTKLSMGASGRPAPITEFEKPSIDDLDIKWEPGHMGYDPAIGQMFTVVALITDQHGRCLVYSDEENVPDKWVRWTILTTPTRWTDGPTAQRIAAENQGAVRLARLYKDNSMVWMPKRMTTVKRDGKWGLEVR